MSVHILQTPSQHFKAPAFQAKSKRTTPPIGHFKAGDLVTRWEYNKPAIYQVTKVHPPDKQGNQGLDVQMIFNDNLETPNRKVQPILGHAASWYEKVTVEKTDRMIQNWTRIKQTILANQ